MELFRSRFGPGDDESGVVPGDQSQKLFIFPKFSGYVKTANIRSYGP